VKPASPPTAQSSGSAKDSTPGGRSHHDHVDGAGTYAERGPNDVDNSEKVKHKVVQEHTPAEPSALPHEAAAEEGGKPVETGANGMANGTNGNVIGTDSVNQPDNNGTPNGAVSEIEQKTTPIPLTEPKSEPQPETKPEAQVAPTAAPAQEPATENATAESKSETSAAPLQLTDASTEAAPTTVETPERRKPRKLGPSKKNSVSNVQFEANVPRAQSVDKQSASPPAEGRPGAEEQSSEPAQPAVSNILGIRGDD
jgi:hypothetical protein